MLIVLLDWSLNSCLMVSMLRWTWLQRLSLCTCSLSASLVSNTLGFYCNIWPVLPMQRPHYLWVHVMFTAACRKGFAAHICSLLIDSAFWFVAPENMWGCPTTVCPLRVSRPCGHALQIFLTSCRQWQNQEWGTYEATRYWVLCTLPQWFQWPQSELNTSQLIQCPSLHLFLSAELCSSLSGGEEKQRLNRWRPSSAVY